MCHYLQNAIKEAVTAEPDWKTYETHLKPCCKMIGDESYKEILLHECYQTAPPLARYNVHKFSAEHVDWRWEYLEEATEQLSDCWEDFEVRFDPKAFTEDAALVAKIQAAIKLVWFGLFTEMMRVFTSIVGHEIRKVEGCYCHEHILVAEETPAKRRRAMQTGASSQLVPLGQS